MKSESKPMDLQPRFSDTVEANYGTSGEEDVQKRCLQPLLRALAKETRTPPRRGVRCTFPLVFSPDTVTQLMHVHTP